MSADRTPARTELCWLIGAGVAFLTVVLLGLAAFLRWHFGGLW